MLSYMVPTDTKPPPGPLLELQAGQRGGGGGGGVAAGRGGGGGLRSSASKNSALSAESSVSSISSVLGGDPPANPSAGASAQTQPSKAKANGGAQAKHPTLKRVSFGSSKGSMVETLIFESPLQEEPESSPPPSIDSSQGSESGKASKVRVTFFECERPRTFSSPEPSDPLVDSLDLPFSVMTTESPLYQRQESTDSGWDNPFRPDGDLSREADQIVELIKGGKPITPTALNGEPPKVAESPSTPTKTKDSQQGAASSSSPPKAVNGKTPAASTANGGSSEPGPGGQVDVKRANVSPSDASQVERVKLSKKPKSKCCVIQ